MRRAAVVLAVLLATGRADAQVSVAVQLNPEGEMLASQLGITSAELAMRMENGINAAYGASDVDGYVRSFADATAFSMRGLGVDYASDPNSLILGVGANFAVAASEQVNAEQRPTSGLSANIGFMAGLNLSSQGAPRWTIFGNGFYRKASTSSLRGAIVSAGLHAQYRIFNPQREQGATTKALRWTGIDVTGGVEFTRWTLGIDDEITTGFGVEGSAGSANLVVISTGAYDLSSMAVSVPIELTTGIRIALLVSMYVGIGADVTAGNGKLEANMIGAMRTSDNRDVGTATITGGGEKTASPVDGRVLAGVQLNLWKLKVYGQVNASLIPAASVGFGIRGVL